MRGAGYAHGASIADRAGQCLEYDALLWVQDDCLCGRNAAAVGVKQVDIVQEPALTLVNVWLSSADMQ